MDATVLHCPGCGAPASPDAASCSFCLAQLANMACPACLGAMYVGMRHCPRCGEAAARQEFDLAANLNCPRCKAEMARVTVGDVAIAECTTCHGAWLDADVFESVVSSQETRAAVIRWHRDGAPGGQKASLDAVRYGGCPHCRKMMNRTNFARISGVIIDVCHAHGTWFDRDELARVATFISDGGLSKSRQAEMLRMKEEERRLRSLRHLRPTEGQLSGMHDQGEPAVGGGLLASLIGLFV